MNMDKAVFKNLITSAQPNPVESTMLGDLLHTFFAFTTRVITSAIDEGGSNNCGKPFQYNRCFSCSQELFTVTNYRSYSLDKNPVL
jgi:hypothetical protein